MKDIGSIEKRVRERYALMERKRLSDASILREYIEGWRLAFPHSAPPAFFTKKERQLLGMLVKKFGEERACYLVRYIFRNWGYLSQVWKVIGAPTVEVVVKFGEGLIVEVDKEMARRKK